MIDRAYFEKVFLEAVNELRKIAPKDSKNLADFAIKYDWKDENTFTIYVDVGDTEAFLKSHEYEQGVAPYMPFVNEEWISPKWKGKQNPNQDWWNKAIENVILPFIAKRLKGNLKQGSSEK